MSDAADLLEPPGMAASNRRGQGTANIADTNPGVGSSEKVDYPSDANNLVSDGDVISSISAAAAAPTAATGSPINIDLDNDFLRGLSWDDVAVVDGELQSIGGVGIEVFKSKDLRTCCSTLQIKGVKNAKKYKMVERITETYHKKRGIVADVKTPACIFLEAQARKRSRIDKISEIAEVVKEVTQQPTQEDDSIPITHTAQQKMQFLLNSDERERQKHRLELEKMKLEMQNTLIDSYSKIISCIAKSQRTSGDDDSLLSSNEFQQDVPSLINLKRSIAKRMFEFQAVDFETEDQEQQAIENRDQYV